MLEPGMHGSTFGGNPLAAAAALAVLDTIERDACWPMPPPWATTLPKPLPHCGIRPSCGTRGRGLLRAVTFEPGAPIAAAVATGARCDFIPRSPRRDPVGATADHHRPEVDAFVSAWGRSPTELSKCRRDRPPLPRDDDLSPAEQAEVLARAAAKGRPLWRHGLAGPQVVARAFRQADAADPGLVHRGDRPSGWSPDDHRRQPRPGGGARVDRRCRQGPGPSRSVASWRTFGQERIAEMAAHAGVPVVNALTDDSPSVPDPRRSVDHQRTQGPLAGLTMAISATARNNMAPLLSSAGPPPAFTSVSPPRRPISRRPRFFLGQRKSLHRPVVR